MKISALITQLTAIQDANDDMEVICYDGESDYVVTSLALETDDDAGAVAVIHIGVMEHSGEEVTPA